MTRNHENVSNWSDMSNRGLLCQFSNSFKIQLDAFWSRTSHGCSCHDIAENSSTPIMDSLTHLYWKQINVDNHFTFWVLCCDVRSEFHMFGSYLPPVVCMRGMSYLRYLFFFSYSAVQHNWALFLFCFSSSCVPDIASFSWLPL